MRKLWIFAPCIAFILFTGCRPDSSDEKLTRARLRELAGVTSWLPANSGLKVKLPNPSTAPPSFATDDLLLDLHNDAADWTQPSAHAQRTEWLSQLSEWRSQAFDGNERNPVRSNEDVESLTKAIRFLVFEARLHGLENDLATASAIMELAANTVVEAIETAPGIRFRDLIPALNTVLAELRCGDTTLHVGADIIAARFTGKQDFRHLSQLKAREEFAESGIRLLHEFAESDEPIDLLSMQLAGGGDPEPYAEILYRITGGVNNFINIEDTVRLAGSWIEADLRLAQGDVGKVEAHTQQIKRLILQDWGQIHFKCQPKHGIRWIWRPESKRLKTLAAFSSPTRSIGRLFPSFSLLT
ncbi:hypothetical protein QM565_14440 [Geitlerinema splendidum]|nr:hypothetical protein [Geitlerinema splendidum]